MSFESDDEISCYIIAAKLAQKAGFHFVDIKHCHGYLGHEFLSVVDRPGKYGGSFENRTRFLREIISGVRAKVPNLEIGVRLSAFDFIPFKPGADGIGAPENWSRKTDYCYAFGGDGAGTGIDLTEPHPLLDLLENLGVELVNITAGSPYYVPHIQRPALFPPSDGYQPLEDPLVGVARLINVTAKLNALSNDRGHDPVRHGSRFILRILRHLTRTRNHGRDQKSGWRQHGHSAGDSVWAGKISGDNKRNSVDHNKTVIY